MEQWYATDGTHLFHGISLLVQLRISKFLAQFQVFTLAYRSVREVLGISAFFCTAPIEKELY